MLTTLSPQLSLWETVLPAPLLVMNPELEAVSELLDDPRFFEPFRAHFDARLGRPSIPIETYLRLMFLKFRHQLSFESLCREVADSISWQRFCRIPLGGRVPHPTTLMKITTRCGPDAVAGLNDALLAKAAEQKLLRVDRVRADSTVVAANVKRPTDSGLLAQAVSRIVRAVERIHAAGGATRTHVVDRRRAAGRRMRAISSKLKLRNDEGRAKVRELTGELAGLAARTCREAAAVARNAKRAGLDHLAEDLATVIERAERIVDQTRRRLRGDMPEGRTRLVSLHDPDARPIRRGRLGHDTEFGYKAQVVDNDDGIVLDHSVHIGGGGDADLLAPAIERITERVGEAPTAVTADRGYGFAKVEADLQDLGVDDVVIPRVGKPGTRRQQLEKRPSFQRMVKWRTGCEGRISFLKRSHGWNRTRLDGINGVTTWCGWGVLVHNSVKIANLAA